MTHASQLRAREAISLSYDGASSSAPISSGRTTTVWSDAPPALIVRLTGRRTLARFARPSAVHCFGWVITTRIATRSSSHGRSGGHDSGRANDDPEVVRSHQAGPGARR